MTERPAPMTKHEELERAVERLTLDAEVLSDELNDLVIRVIEDDKALHRDGALSEGQAAKLTGLDRVEVRKLSDALAASTPVGGWEDISTAPKDGTSILVANAYGEIFVVCWGADTANGPGWIDGATDFVGDLLIYTAPTHWMPLPPPPSVSIDNGSLQAEDRPSVPAEGHDAAVVDRRPFADVFAEAYGWTVDVDGYLAGLVAGDMGYDQTDLLLSDLLVDAQVAEDRRNRTTQGGPYSWPFHEALMAFVSTGHAARTQPADGCSSNEGAASSILPQTEKGS